MFTTTATIKKDLGVLGLSVVMFRAGDEVTVCRSTCYPLLWEVVSGPHAGAVIDDSLLSFELP